MKKLLVLLFVAAMCMPGYGAVNTNILVYKFTSAFNPWIDYSDANQTLATNVGTRQMTGYLVLDVNLNTWELNADPTLIFYGTTGKTKWGTYFDANNANGSIDFEVFDIVGKTYDGLLLDIEWNTEQERVGASRSTLYGKTVKVDIGKGAGNNRKDVPSSMKGIVEQWAETNDFFEGLGNTTMTLNSKYTKAANQAEEPNQADTVEDIIRALVKLGYTFERLPWVTYTLTYTAGADGSITAPATSPTTHNSGDIVTITASADPLYHFVNWTGDVGTVANTSAASTTITMSGNYSITANFAVAPDYNTGAVSIQSLAVASDGTLYAVDGDGYVNKIVSGVVTAHVGIGESPSGARIAVSADGNTLYVGTQNAPGNILTFNAATLAAGTPIATFGGTSVNSLAVASDGTLYAADGAGYINKIVSGVVTAHVGIGESPYGDVIALSSDGNTLYLGTRNDGNIHPFDTATLTEGTAIVAHGGTGGSYTGIYSFAVSGTTLYAADADGYVNKIVSGAVTAYAGIGESPYADRLAVSSDGTTLYVGTRNSGNILTFNTATLAAGTPIATGATAVNAVAISPDGTTLYVGDRNSGNIYPITVGYTLTYTADAHGTITAPASSPTTHAIGGIVTITASADPGYHFVNWTGSDVSTIANVNAADTTITMNGNYAITATFTHH